VHFSSRWSFDLDHFWYRISCSNSCSWSRNWKKIHAIQIEGTKTLSFNYEILNFWTSFWLQLWIILNSKVL
jgi:hypothetical protein